MKMLALAGLFAIIAADEPNEAKKKAVQAEMEKFAGKWEFVTKGGTGDATQLKFNKDGTYATFDAKGKELWKGTFDLDPTAKPKIWDHREEDEPKKTGRDILGIYELDGDKLKVCVTVGYWKDGKWTGKPRPSEIKNVKFKNGAYTVIEMKRIK